MPEIPEVNPGEVATAAEHNFAWRRAVQRYPNADIRDIENPAPEAGDVAFLEDVATLMVYAGDGWGAAFGARDGIPSLPSYTFEGDDDTGMFRPGSDVLGLIAGGVHGVQITSARIQAIDSTVGGYSIKLDDAGSSAEPTYAFRSDPDTGMYRSGTNDVRIAAGGTEKMSWRGAGVASQAIFDNTTGSAANMFIVGTSYLMQRSTSARKYKSNIEYIV